METNENKFKESKQDYTQYAVEDTHHPRSGRVFGGLIIVAVGVVWLLNRMGTVIFPDWLFTWPMFLIVLGFYIGVRHGFRGWGGWLIMMLVGGVFLSENFFPNMNISDYVWPVIIIGVGLLMVVRPRRRHWGGWGDKEYWKNNKHQWKIHYKYGGPMPSSPGTGTYTQDDFVDSTNIFGGVHKIIMSKDFKGGDMVNIFGGGELNLSQADIKGPVVLDIVQIFGGLKLIIPADWSIQIKMVSVFGGVEDKRLNTTAPNPEKTLIIDGTSIFAGVSISNY